MRFERAVVAFGVVLDLHLCDVGCGENIENGEFELGNRRGNIGGVFGSGHVMSLKKDNGPRGQGADRCVDGRKPYSAA